MLNAKKICHERLTDLFTSLVICSHFTLEKSKKSHFSTLLFIYFTLFTLSQKKTNSNCCTAALAVYLLLFNASYYLHSPSTASGACYRRSTCIDMDILRLARAVCCDVGWISAQRGVLCDWSVSKWLEACVNAEGGHFEHLLRHCLPDIPVATHHNRLFSEPPMTIHNWLFTEPPTFERTQRISSQMKKFCILQVSVVTFSGGQTSGLRIVFLWDNVNNHKYNEL